jgi:hypothetical protein
MRKLVCLLSILFFTGCADQVTPEREESQLTTTSRCGLVPETGPCKAAFKKYYFDKIEKKCKEFTWGGCGGVVPFNTLEECKSCGEARD